MPLIDVTELLIDTDIAGQKFTVLRRQETVNNFGESVPSIKNCPAIGSVQPSSDQGLIREEGFDAQAKSITVVTTFRLRGVSKGPSASRFKPDIILWRDNYFEVISPTSWADFGAGFIEAEAKAIAYVDFATQFLPAYVGRLDFSKPNNAIYAHGAANIF